MYYQILLKGKIVQSISSILNKNKHKTDFKKQDRESNSSDNETNYPGNKSFDFDNEIYCSDDGSYDSDDVIIHSGNESTYSKTQEYMDHDIVSSFEKKSNINTIRNINNCNNPKRIYLNDCTLTNDILLKIYQSKDLEYLYLTNCGICDIPDGIFELNNLKYLNLSGNIICKIPEKITKLKNLEYLDLENNIITYVPKSINNLKLIHLNLEKNMIYKIANFDIEFLNLKNNPVYYKI